MPTPIYDWDKISKDFIQGIEIKDATTGEYRRHYPTHEELCETHKCAMTTIRSISFREKWQLQRTQYLRKLRQRNRELDLNDLLGIGTKFEAFHLQALESVQIILQGMLEPYRKLVENPDSVEDLELRRLNTTDLKNIVQTIRLSHDLVRDIIGEDKNPVSLLDEVREQYAGKRNKQDGRSLAQQRLRKLTKQAQEADKLKEELELKKKLLQAARDEARPKDKEQS